MDISQIITATSKGKPTRVLAHSQEGWGKTWLAAHFPNVVWIAPENGFPRDLQISTQVIPVKRWEDVLAAAVMLRDQRHEFVTLAIDTVDWIEPMIHRFVLQRDSGRESELNKKGRVLESIEDYGYGKGYIAADEEWRRFLLLLDDVQARRGMHVVMLAHSHVKTFKNPAGEDFDRWQPKVHERIGRVCVEWAETVLFGFFDLSAGKIGDERRAKGVSDGKRLVGLRYAAMYDAKNRLGLPPVVELTDASQFVGYLLGQHMPNAAANVEPVSIPWQGSKDDARSAHAVAGKALEQYASNVAATVGKAHDEATYQQSEAPSKNNTRMVERDPTDTGRMHSSAQLKEQQRDHAKPVEPKTEAPKTSKAKPAADVDQSLLADLTDVQTLAAKHSVKLAHDVATWIKQATGDQNKLRSIVQHVRATCAPQGART